MKNICDNKSCRCELSSKKGEEADNQEKEKPNSENKKAEEQDPTKFGDWQINGRTIDF